MNEAVPDAVSPIGQVKVEPERFSRRTVIYPSVDEALAPVTSIVPAKPFTAVMAVVVDSCTTTLSPLATPVRAVMVIGFVTVPPVAGACVAWQSILIDVEAVIVAADGAK